MSANHEKYQPRKYVVTSEQLLAPEVGAVEIGKLELGAYEAVKRAMEQAALAHAVLTPAMVADIIFKEGMRSEFGSAGKPYMIRGSDQWEAIACDVPGYCGDNVPSVYMVDGSKYTTGI